MARRAPPHTKSDLLRAAEACFVEAGLDRTTVEAITSRTGVAKGAFYTYFSSKEECWNDVLNAFLARMSAAVDEPVDEPSSAYGGAFEAEVAHNVRLLEFCWINRGFMRVLMTGAGVGEYAHLVDEFARGARRRAEALVREAVSQGTGRDDLDPTLVARLVAGAYESLVRELIHLPQKPDLEHWCLVAHQTLLFGFLSESARASVAARASAMTKRTRSRRSKGNN